MTWFPVKGVTMLSAISLGFILLVGAATYASDDLPVSRQEIESLKAGQQAIQKDLRKIKELLVTHAR